MTYVRTCEDTHLFHTEDQELMEKTTKEDEEQTGRSTDSWYQSSAFSPVSTWSRKTFLSCVWKAVLTLMYIITTILTKCLNMILTNHHRTREWGRARTSGYNSGPASCTNSKAGSKVDHFAVFGTLFFARMFTKSNGRNPCFSFGKISVEEKIKQTCFFAWNFRPGRLHSRMGPVTLKSCWPIHHFDPLRIFVYFYF